MARNRAAFENRGSAHRSGGQCVIENHKRWSYFIRKVYEADPLTCPRCQGEMRIICFIDQPEVIKKILQHLGLWEESHAPRLNRSA